MDLFVQACFQLRSEAQCEYRSRKQKSERKEEKIVSGVWKSPIVQLVKSTTPAGK